MFDTSATRYYAKIHTIYIWLIMWAPLGFENRSVYVVCVHLEKETI
jgi:hypothetical protein